IHRLNDLMPVTSPGLKPLDPGVLISPNSWHTAQPLPGPTLPWLDHFLRLRYPARPR
ncbi:unnamed protein product, partial [Tilletia laevis]